MVGKSNVVCRPGSVGDMTSDMIIAVTFPAGSVSTCTNGTRTLRSVDTLGACVFHIPAQGTWTVSCTDGFASDSKAFNVTEGSFNSVNLLYSLTRMYLKNNLLTTESTTATAIAAYGYRDRTALTSVKSSAVSVGGYAFSGCSSLTVLDLTNTDPVTIAANAFNGASALQHVIIRSSSASTLSNVSAFTNSKMVKTGDFAVYVPAALLDSYKAATNWSTYAKHIFPIGSYPLTDFSTISDSWSEIFDAEDDGTYITKYAVGDTKFLEYNGTNVCAEIAAMDSDELSSGTGYAKITWILKPILELHNMNSSNTTTGGWASSAMRTYVRETCLARLPSDIRNRIVEVNKTYYDYSTTSTLTVADTVWIPSFYEVTGNSSIAESSGVSYTGLFGTAGYSSGSTSRVKYRLNTGAADLWWLRSAYGATGFRYVYTTGNASYSNVASNANGLVLGFCT